MTRQLTLTGNILTDAESDELQKYKKDIRIKFGILLSVSSVSLLILLLMFRELLLMGYFLVGVTFLMLISILVLERLIEYLRYFFLNIFTLIFFLFIHFTLWSFLTWQANDAFSRMSGNYYFILSGGIMLCTVFYSGIVYGQNSFQKEFRSWVKTGKINTGDNTYNAFQIRNSKKGRKKFVFITAILFAFYPMVWALSFILKFRFDPEEAIAMVALPVFSFLLLFLSGKIFSTYLSLRKWEAENNRVLYTTLIRYINLEDEINEWRRSWKSLKPVKIKSLFFDGNVYK